MNCAHRFWAGKISPRRKRNRHPDSRPRFRRGNHFKPAAHFIHTEAKIAQSVRAGFQRFIRNAAARIGNLHHKHVGFLAQPQPDLTGSQWRTALFSDSFTAMRTWLRIADSTVRPGSMIET